jgi:hypothetical protein
VVCQLGDGEVRVSKQREVLGFARAAVGALTAWPDDATVGVVEEFRQRLPEGGLAVGMLLVAEQLLHRLCEATGQARGEVLQDLGARFAQLEADGLGG